MSAQLPGFIMIKGIFMEVAFHPVVLSFLNRNFNVRRNLWFVHWMSFNISHWKILIHFFSNLGHKNMIFSAGVYKLHSGLQLILDNDSVKTYFSEGRQDL